MREDVRIYTDGSARPTNPGPAGWGAVLVDESGVIGERDGGEDYATNNRMEALACVEGLRAVEGEGVRVVVCSDSSYVVGTMTKGWKRRKNRDLWPLLDDLCRRHEVLWQLVPGHAGDIHNERAHELAHDAAGARNGDAA